MSHHIYTTPGFVVDSYPNGESGKFIYIFTRDLGMVAGVATGIRLSQSKLRYHAQDFSLSNFSLVRGKEVWRIVGAESIAADTPPTLSPLFVRVLKILRRLIPGEEKNEILFETILSAYYHLASDQSHHQNVEYIIMLRILHQLGYIRKVATLEVFLTDHSFTPELSVTAHWCIFMVTGLLKGKS